MRSAPASFRVGVVFAAALVLVAATQACSSGGGGGTSTSTGDGGASPSAASEADAVLLGRWERVFSGLDFDFPNMDPWLDARDGRAHFVYRSKTGALRYFVFDAQGARTEVTFPQGTKLIGRVAVLPSGESVVTGVEAFSAQVSSFRRAAGATAAEVAPPLDPARGRVPVSFESVAFGGDAVFAGVAATGDRTVAVDRLGSAGWESLGDFPQPEGVSRVRLTSQGESLALAIYTGSSARSVRRYERGAWRELEGLPPTSGPVGVPSLVLDGDRVFLLEYQESSSTAVVWVHDGKAWSEFARSEPAEGLRALVLHQGALYALYGDVPNKGLPVTFGVARVDRGRITRSPFDSQSAQANIDPDSRHDVMSQEACQLVSSGPELFLSYMEGISDGTSLRLYKHVRR